MGAVEEFRAQGRLEAGEAGWWPVWGARPCHAAAGDVMMLADETFEVSGVYVASAAPMRVGIVVDGVRQTVGAMCPIVLLRRGTHNVLA